MPTLNLRERRCWLRAPALDYLNQHRSWLLCDNAWVANKFVPARAISRTPLSARMASLKRERPMAYRSASWKPPQPRPSLRRSGGVVVVADVGLEIPALRALFARHLRRRFSNSCIKGSVMY